MASLDSTAFLAGLSDACGVRVATGALYLWTQLPLGGAAMQSRPFCHVTDTKSSWMFLLLRGVR